jgi:acetate kinase
MSLEIPDTPTSPLRWYRTSSISAALIACSRICARCAWLGIILDERANGAAAPRITAQASRVRVYVIPTDEERMIAEHTVKHIGQAALLN